MDNFFHFGLLCKHFDFYGGIFQCMRFQRPCFLQTTVWVKCITPLYCPQGVSFIYSAISYSSQSRTTHNLSNVLLLTLSFLRSRAGKTSLLNALFQEMTSFLDDFAGKICEYRWGEQELTTPPVDGVQKKFVTMENMRGISIVDTKGIHRFSQGASKKVKE